MELRDVLKDLEVETRTGSRDPGDMEILGIADNSNEAGKGFLFIAVRGKTTDGHMYADAAVRNGASAVLAEEFPLKARDREAVFVKTRDSRAAACVAAANFHGRPSLGMKVVGVTGTNGKTTVTHMIEAAWEAQGLRAGMLGTIENRYAGRSEPSSLTTPGALDLARTLREMKDAGVTHVALEVSSHALDLKRTDACHFDAAVFTNLTQDHLDYHLTIEDYFGAKRRLFAEILERSEKKEVYAVVNADDPFADRIPAPGKGSRISFSLERKDATVFAEKFSLDASGIRATLATPWGKVELDSSLMGKHNLRNMMAATGALLSLGSPPGAVGRALSGLARVPGRLERVKNSLGLNVFVDYAHTPDALENVLGCLRPLCGGSLVTVVGCGGDRDAGKRPLMAAVGRKYSDRLIITSDNPRTEDPESIIADMLRGTRAGDPAVDVVSDREEAIGRAVGTAESGDMILIAGKGHEDYQVIGTEKIRFDDREAAARHLAARSGERI